MLRVAGHGRVTEIALDRPPANALNLALVSQLHAAHAESCVSGARAIVLTGRPGMFSAGLDVPDLLPQDRPAILAFWRAFFDLTHALATSPVPVVAAVSGHAPAGGAVLAVHCDYRIAARGPFQIGLNEVAVGLPVPASIMIAYRELIGARRAHILAMSGKLLAMEEALQAGLVDELAEPDRLMAQALDVAQRLADLPPIAMNRTRLLSRAGLARAMDPAAEAAAATDYWFSPETQAGMRALAERLAKK
jgi:enoyl-CoA hydratase/carnithine racemase